VKIVVAVLIGLFLGAASMFALIITATATPY
jgi:hypothetical protein